jgi:hypothetical protein
MAFSEDIKSQVKRKSAFRCCRCQQIGVEVHHIVPQKDGGKDDIDNAAPLCPNCHTAFGDSPLKRKEIREMMDWWYEQAEKMFNPSRTDYGQLEKINTLVDAVERNSASIGDLKDSLKQFANQVIDTISPSSARRFASNMTSSSSDLTIRILEPTIHIVNGIGFDSASTGEEANAVGIVQSPPNPRIKAFDESE